MKRFFPILLCLMVSHFCLAQNIGYMGQHVLFNAQGALSPSWFKPNPLTPCLNEHITSNGLRRYLGLNYILSPNMEVIVWRKGSLGAGYNYFNSPFNGNIGRDFPLTTPYFSEYYAIDGIVEAHGFNLFYKQYMGETRAPLGAYAKFTFDGFFYHYNCKNELPSWINTYYPEFKEDKGMLFGLKVEFGYDYLFFNRLRLSAGVSFGSTFGGYDVLGSSFKDNPTYYDPKITVHSFAQNRILSAYWFGIQLGLGFLAF